MATEKRLIDADAEIEAIKNYACKDCDSYNGIRCRACWADDLMNWIDDAHKVDAVEVVHGRWQKVYTCSGERLWGYECEQCKADSPKESNYCPNCGAKMDGDVNG